MLQPDDLTEPERVATIDACEQALKAIAAMLDNNQE